MRRARRFVELRYAPPRAARPQIQHVAQAMTFWLGMIAAVVGILIGTVGVGGILLIPALELLVPLSIQAAMATALFTFIFTGIIGTWLFQRRGSIDWTLTAPLCLGGALFGLVGAWANSRLDARVLALILAAFVVLVGAYTLFTGTARRSAYLEHRPRLQRALLFTIGAVTGLGSGLTGVGGPALAVPMLVLCGFPTLSAVGASQVIQIVASVSGSAVHLMHGTIDMRLAAPLTVFEMLGVVIGVRLAHAIDAHLLRRAVGLLCVAVGALLLMRLIGGLAGA